MLPFGAIKADGAEKAMIAHMEHEKATTFQQALADPAVHNAPFFPFSVAWSSSTKVKIGVHLIGIAMAVCAGMVNAIAVVKFIIYVSRVSRVSTSVGLRMETGQAGDVPSVAEILL